MILTIKNYTAFLLILIILTVSACSKQKGFGPNDSAYITADVPVSVQNSIANRPDPTVSASLGSSDSAITIILTIPSTSGRTIKEITKVAAASSYSPIQSTGTTGFYNVPVIPGSGTTVTFKTSLGAYLKQFTTEKLKVNTELVNRFYFRLTLDDGSIVYPTPVRVLVLS